LLEIGGKMAILSLLGVSSRSCPQVSAALELQLEYALHFRLVLELAALIWDVLVLVMPALVPFLRRVSATALRKGWAPAPGP
jgi:hypothetical protein